MLHAGGICYRGGCEDEGNSNASNGAEGDLAAAEEREEKVLDDGAEDYAGDRVKGLDRVVGYAAELHLAGLRDDVVHDLVVAEVEDHEANDDTAALKTALEFVYETCCPWDRAVATRSLFSWHGCGEAEARTAGDEEDFDSLRENITRGMEFDCRIS